jgi:alpha-beta hydrolase superfamily lysophospholipase
MIEFSLTSKDEKELFGRHWAIENPKAAMVLVHGFGEHCGRYEHMASYLNTQGIAVVAADMRGHGKSEGKRGVVSAYDDFREDLDALLTETRRLYPNTPLTLYGHSMGGGIVLDYGSRLTNDLPIIASAPLITLTDPIPKGLRTFARFMGKVFPKGALAQPIDGTKISNLPDEQALYLNDPLNHGKMGFRLAETMVVTGENLQDSAKDWDRPLLLLHSKADQLTGFNGSAEFAKHAKQVAFHPFEQVQHEMHNDSSRTKVYKLMSDFILKQAQ